MTEPTGCWYIITEDGDAWRYREGTGPPEPPPVERIDGFDEHAPEGYYSMDLWDTSDEGVPTDERFDKDASGFYLVPKDDIVRHEFREYGSEGGPTEPQEIEAYTGADLMEKLQELQERAHD